VIKYYCDKCGEEADLETNHSYTVTDNTKLHKRIYYKGDGEIIVCHKCELALDKIFIEYVDNISKCIREEIICE
jgi:hypothetical protein